MRVRADGRLATVAADSPQDVANSLGVLVATRTGERLSVPGYGVPDPLFSGPDDAAIRAAVSVWEPRADLDALDITREGDGAATVTMTAGG